MKLINKKPLPLAPRAQRGFTLIELSVTGFIMVVLGTAILGLQKLLSDSQLIGFVNYTNVDEANYSVSQMAREIRTMRQGQNGAYPLVLATDNEIRFYSDIDFDGESDLVRYTLNGQTLTKGVIKPTGFPATYPPANEITRTITENVQNEGISLFLYFNDGWPKDSVNNPLPTPANIAEVSLVRITLNININPDNAEGSTYSLSTNANIRTLKNNL